MTAYIGMHYTIKEELIGGPLTVTANSKDGAITIRDEDDVAISIMYSDAQLLVEVLQTILTLRGKTV